MFRDSIHGYINIPKCFVDNLIDTEMFQRLRNIDQTGMRILYPAAKHDRFSHSLGVYHLGSKAVDTLLENFSQDKYWYISSDGKALTYWAKNKILFLIACLLHDIGHTPFSHALERIVLENSAETITDSSSTTHDSSISAEKTSENRITITKQLANCINKLEGNNDETLEKKIKKAASHEQLGSLYILENLKEPINKIFKSLQDDKYPLIETDTFLYAEHYCQNTTIEGEINNDELAFIARMILGIKYNNYEPKYQIRNCFIELLNGNSFDVDKLDYVIRDTKMSGISNIDIDTDRLLNSVCIITQTKYVNKSISFKAAKEYLVTNLKNDSENDSLHIEGDFRGIIALQSNAKIRISKGSTFATFEPNSDEKIELSNKESELNVFFSGETTITKDNKKLTQTTAEGNYKLSAGDDMSPISVTISNATLVSDFVFTVRSTNPTGFIKLEVNGKCNIEIKGKFASISPIRIFDANLEGTISEMEVAKNTIEGKVPNKNSYNIFTIGYKKQAINVISNVMEARDYLYLWVYAHHKVIYYANFLIPIIAKYVMPKNKETCSLDYKHLELLDDSYVWTKVKEVYKNLKESEIDDKTLISWKELTIQNYIAMFDKMFADSGDLLGDISAEKLEAIKNYIYDNIKTNGINWNNIIEIYKCQKSIEIDSELIHLCEDLFKRKYRQSLYKSLAEFDLLFEEIETKKRMKIKQLMIDSLNTDSYQLEDPVTGYLCDDFVKLIKEKANGKLDNITDVVYVDAAYSLKTLNADETLIMINKSIASLGEIPLLSSKPKILLNSKYYFYLYYRTSTTSSKELVNEANEFKQIIRDIVSEKVLKSYSSKNKVTN